MNFKKDSDTGLGSKRKSSGVPKSKCFSSLVKLIDPKKIFTAETKEYLRKNAAQLAVSFYMGMAITIVGVALLQSKQDANIGPRIDEFWNPTSTALVSYDDLAVLYVTTGAMLTNPAEEERIRKAFLSMNVYGKRPLVEYMRGITPELYKRRERQFLGFVANFGKLEREGKLSAKPASSGTLTNDPR